MTETDFISFFKDQLTEENIDITPLTKFKQIDGWDSLTAMLVLTSLKEDFNINLTVSELLACETIADIIKVVNSK